MEFVNFLDEAQPPKKEAPLSKSPLQLHSGECKKDENVNKELDKYQDFEKLAEKYKEVCRKESELKKDKAILRSGILKAINNKPCMRGGLKIVMVETKGSVNWEAMALDTGVDPEDYRKSKTTSLKILNAW